MAPSFWQQAMSAACHVANRMSTKSHPDTSPMELLTGEKPNNDYFRRFGSLAFPVTPGYKKSFQPRAEKGIMVGYAAEGYVLYIPKRNILLRSASVDFDEGVYKRGERKNALANSTSVTLGRFEESEINDIFPATMHIEEIPLTTRRQNVTSQRHTRTVHLESQLSEEEVSVGSANDNLARKEANTRRGFTLPRETQLHGAGGSQFAAPEAALDIGGHSLRAQRSRTARALAWARCWKPSRLRDRQLLRETTRVSLRYLTRFFWLTRLQGAPGGP